MGKRKYLEYKRKCPSCGVDLKYKSPNSFYLATKKNSRCRSCTVKSEYTSNPLKNKGVLNGRYGKSLIEVMQNKHGQDWKRIYKQWKENQNRINKSGKNNPSYGKTYNGGRSIKGLYKNLHFRSSLELIFILNFELKNKFLPESAEENRFRAFSEEFSVVPDYFCRKCGTVYEVKMEYFVSNAYSRRRIVLSKAYIESLGYKYKIITEKDLGLSKSDISNLVPLIKKLRDLAFISLEKNSEIRLNNNHKQKSLRTTSKVFNRIKDKFSIE